MGNPILEAFYSLGSNTNKSKGNINQETEQGVASPKMPELELSMTAKEITDLTTKWEKAWNESDVKAQFEKKGDENENYWLGKHFQRPEIDKTRAAVDNAIFESLETYLPQITRRNPDPMVTLASGVDQSEENLKFAHDLQIKLGEVADEVSLRLKLKKAGRHWAIYLLGVAKKGWDMNKNIPTTKILRPKKMILDPKATVDEDGYSGKYVGEHRSMEAGMLIDTLTSIEGEEDGIKAIKELVKDDLGTDVGFIEWWTNEYMCWTIKDKLLLKKKNPHWNYDKDVPMQADETGQPPIGEDGKPQTQKQPGLNHLAVPGMPYVFLSVFNLGKQPVDDTSLIGQNLANQDRINKRFKQIDKNADGMNGGMVVSLARSGLSQQQAKGVTQALKDGGVVAIPDGAPDEAIKRSSAPELPATIYNDLVDTRNRMRDIFGTRGSLPAGQETETTVRGKLMNRTADTDRIGGGVSEYLEQMADALYNWDVQMLYVYDDTYSQLPPATPKVKVSVKEGSLLPKDSTTIANQAIELTSGGKMAIIDLYKRLDYPNPEELAANVWLEANAPELLFGKDPRVQQAIQMKQQQAQAAAQAGAAAEKKPPSTSINFKDLPPDGQAQLAAEAGITLHPEAIAAHNEHKGAVEAARSMPAPTEEAPVTA